MVLLLPLLLKLLRRPLQMHLLSRLQPCCQLLLLSLQVPRLLPLTSSCWQLLCVSLQVLLIGCRVHRCLGKLHGQLGVLLQH
jgi:hypothetical protein